MARIRREGYPPPTKNTHKNIAILLIIKGIAIAFVKYYDYICIALKHIKYWVYWTFWVIDFMSKVKVGHLG